MLRVNVGLSRKLSRDYNSTGFTINLDGEISAPTNDPEAVMEQVKELFDLAEEALDQQIDRAQSEGAIASRDAEPASQTNGRGATGDGHHASPNGNGKPSQSGNGQHDEPATNKQVQFMLSIGKRQGLSTVELEQKIAETLGQEIGLYDLTKRDAARVIDALTKEPTNGRSYARR